MENTMIRKGKESDIENWMKLVRIVSPLFPGLETEDGLKDGQSCIIRSPRVEDAEQLIEYLMVTASETEFLTRYPEEVKVSKEKEQGIIQWFIHSDSDLMLVAEVDGKIVGNCSYTSVGTKIRVRHRCSLGIALYKKFYGLGLGTYLMQVLIEKAQECGYEQIELNVSGKNERAIALYQKMGFTQVGCIPNAIKHKDGAYDSDCIMVKQF